MPCHTARRQHKDEPGNMVQDSWDFTDENYKRVRASTHVLTDGDQFIYYMPCPRMSHFYTRHSNQVELILARYPKNYKAAGIIPMLDLAQRQVRYGCVHTPTEPTNITGPTLRSNQSSAHL